METNFTLQSRNWFWRPVFAVAIFAAAIFFSPYLVFFLALLYAWYFMFPFELALFGFLIDAYFGVGGVFPYLYTLGAFLILVAKELMGRYLNLDK